MDIASILKQGDGFLSKEDIMQQQLALVQVDERFKQVKSADEAVEIIVAMLKQHSAANHPLFAYLDNRSTDAPFTKEHYQHFRINFIARTLFTIPEVFKGAEIAALHLNAIALANSAAIGADEGGVNFSTKEGEPHRAHSILMLKSLNYHGKKVFGLDPVDAAQLLGLMRIMDTARELLITPEPTSPVLKNRYDALKGTLFEDINQTKLPIFSEGMMEAMFYEPFMGKTADEWQKEKLNSTMIMTQAMGALYKMGVNQETIVYAFEQFAINRNVQQAAVIGTAWAHETLADNMMETMRAAFFTPYKRFYKKGEFDKEVDPYFAAHRDDDAGSHVEELHAQRMRETLKTVLTSPVQMQLAYNAALAFAERQAKVWDGLLKGMQDIDKAAGKFTGKITVGTSLREI